jgi:hypothetical protein
MSAIASAAIFFTNILLFLILFSFYDMRFIETNIDVPSNYDDAMIRKKLLSYGEVAELLTVLLRREIFQLIKDEFVRTERT